MRHVLQTVLSGVAAVGAAVWLAGCVSQAKAPVVDHSVTRGAAQTSTPSSYVVRPKDTLYSIAFRHEMDYRALAAANGIEPPYLIKPGQRIRLAEATPPPQATPRPAPERRAERTAPRATPVQISPAAPSVQPKPPAPEVASREAPSTPKPATPTPRPSTPAQPAAAPPTKPTPPKPSPAKPTPAKPAPPPPPPTRAKPPAPKTPAAAKSGWQRPVTTKPVRRFGSGSKGFDYELPPATRIRAATAGVVVYAGPGIGGFRHLVIVKASDRHLVAYGVNVQPLLSEGDQVSAGAAVAEVQGNGKTAGRFHFEIRDGGKPVDPGPLIGV